MERYVRVRGLLHLLLPQVLPLKVLLQRKLMGLQLFLKVPNYIMPLALLLLLLQCPWHRQLGLPKHDNMLDLLLLLLRNAHCHLGCPIHRPLVLPLRKFNLLYMLVLLL